MHDVVIVGGGTSGCVLAARLSEDADRSVLLLEEGPDDSAYDDLVRDPRRAVEQLGGGSHAEPFTMDGDGGPISMVRGRGLGGTSAVNFLAATRGRPEDYDGWGLPGWGWNDLLPLFERAEAQLGVTPWAPEELSLAAGAFLEGVAGAEVLRAARHPDGTRRTVSEAYLTPDVRARPNLEIRTGTRVERLDDVVDLAGEVVLSCGATRTPALLQRSGIDVGDGLQDHLGISAIYSHPGPSRLGGSPAQVLLAGEDGHLIPTVVADDGTTTYVSVLAFLLDLDDRGRVDGDVVVAQRRGPRDVERFGRILGRLAEWEGSDAFGRLHLTRLGDLPDPETAPLVSYGHLASTCAMGSRLDAGCRLLGVDGVRVVDASSIPRLPAATPYVTCVVLAERVAAMMRS